MFAVSKRIAHFTQDVWSIFSPMAVYCKAVNLGQGFPNFESPEFIKEAASKAIHNNVNQYSPPKGISSLRTALSKTYGPLFNRELNAESEIIVTAGANEGMYAIFQAFLNRDDEVLVFEPFFDQYAPNITMSGGKLIYCPLKTRSGLDLNANISARDWTIDLKELECKITTKTKILILNTPHNPIGKVFDKEELLGISQLAIKHNLLVISDEVYEHLTFPGVEHVRISTLPQMWERTITVGSAGKSFAVTGWRIGWLIGPPHLITPSLTAHSRIVFCANAPLQEATAAAFAQCEVNNFFENQKKLYEEKRDYLIRVFEEVGLPVTVPDGSYFILVDVSKLEIPSEQLERGEEVEKLFCQNGIVSERTRDWKVCRWLTTEIGVAAIPPSEFYGPDNRQLAERYARFCFCKTQETLEEAKKRLLKLKAFVK